jgi:hypothetical protein
VHSPFARGGHAAYLWPDAEEEIAKEKIKKMSSVCEKKHDKVIQQFVEEATMVRMNLLRN